LISNAKSWQDYGSYDISWYNYDKTDFEISTPAQLAGVAFLVNNGYTDFYAKSITIVEDISLDNITWEPIGTNGFPFCGTIDGNNKTISDININKDSAEPPYVNYGFFGYVKNGHISNLKFKGLLDFKIDNYYPEQFIGGIAAQMYNSEVKDCHSEIEICYDRDEADNANYVIYVGGLIGYSQDNTFENCSFRASISGGIGGLLANVVSDNLHYFKNSVFYMAGLCASDYSSVLKYCYSEIPQFLFNICGSKNADSMGQFAGGLIASSRHSSIHSCHTIIDKVIMKDRSSKPTSFSFHGLSNLPDNYKNNTNDGIYNCYSVVKNLEFASGTTKSNVNYGGISAYTFHENASYKFKSNYSNSDYNIQSYDLPQIEGYMGLTTFDSNEMKNEAFVNELNLYFTLNGEEPKWILGDNRYPQISSEKSGISNIQKDKSNAAYTIYNINGVCLKQNAKQSDINSLSPGLYIIGNRKIVVR